MLCEHIAYAYCPIRIHPADIELQLFHPPSVVNQDRPGVSKDLAIDKFMARCERGKLLSTAEVGRQNRLKLG